MKSLKTKTNLTQTTALISQSRQRDLNADILRIIAVLFVFLTHFFLQTEFYTYKVNSLTMTASLCLRNLGLLCIPLFMLLTGYLQAEKKITPDLKYFSKLVKFTIPHILVILSAILVKICLHGASFSAASVLKHLFIYPGYSWYVEMYIGLFLMIPFLNIMWQNLSSKKQELTLVCVLIILSVLPSVVNVYNIGSPNWYKSSSQPYNQVIPQFWTLLYPITHYFVGACLKKYCNDIKKKPLTAFLIFAACFIVSSAYNIVRNLGDTPSVYSWVGNSSFLNLAVASSLLLFIMSLDFSRVPQALRKFITKLADLSFVAYLASYIVDTNLYPHIENYIPHFTRKLMLLPVIVITVAVASFTISFLLSLISKPLEKYTQKLILRLEKKKQ